MSCDLKITVTENKDDSLGSYVLEANGKHCTARIYLDDNHRMIDIGGHKFKTTQSAEDLKKIIKLNIPMVLNLLFLQQIKKNSQLIGYFLMNPYTLLGIETSDDDIKEMADSCKSLNELMSQIRKLAEENNRSMKKIGDNIVSDRKLLKALEAENTQLKADMKLIEEKLLEKEDKEDKKEDPIYIRQYQTNEFLIIANNKSCIVKLLSREAFSGNISFQKMSPYTGPVCTYRYLNTEDVGKLIKDIKFARDYLSSIIIDDIDLSAYFCLRRDQF